MDLHVQMISYFFKRSPFPIAFAGLCMLLCHFPLSIASNPDRIEIYIYGPVRAQIVDTEGLRSGREFGSGQRVEEIPGSEVVKEETRERISGWTIRLLEPSPGTYRILLKGTGTGGFVIDVDAVDSAGHARNSHIFRRIGEGDTFEFALLYSNKPGGKSTLIEVSK